MADTKFDYKAEGLKSLYAAAGAYDLAFETAKKLATEQVAEVKTLVADLQKKVAEFDAKKLVNGRVETVSGEAKSLQAELKTKLADLQKQVTEFEFDVKKLQGQATSLVNARVEALTKEAKELQGKVESLVADLTKDAKSFPAKLQAEVKGLPARFESLVADAKGYPTKAQTYVTSKVNATVSDVNGQYAEFASRGEKAVAALRKSGAEAVVDAPVAKPAAKTAPAKKAPAKKAPAKKAAAEEA